MVTVTMIIVPMVTITMVTVTIVTVTIFTVTMVAVAILTVTMVTIIMLTIIPGCVYRILFGINGSCGSSENKSHKTLFVLEMGRRNDVGTTYKCMEKQYFPSLHLMNLRNPECYSKLLETRN